MKKIVYLILLLTCHLWSTQLWGAIVKVGVSEDGAGNIANTPYVEVTMDDSANWGSVGHGEFARVYLNFNFEYHYVNAEGRTMSINVAHVRESKYTRGTKIVSKYFWKQPTEATVTLLAYNRGYHEMTNGPRVTITLRPGNGYTVDAAHSTYIDGVPLYYSDWQSDDNDYYDLSDDTIKHYLDGHCVSEDPRLTRHLLHHRKTVYSISQGTENDKYQKTKVSFNTTGFRPGVLMEHWFRLVYEYTYSHHSLNSHKQVIMTKDVTALLPTGKDNNVCTVSAPYPPYSHREYARLRGFSISKIKVTLETPHMLPTNEKSSYYYDGPLNNLSDNQKGDDHFGHKWDIVCNSTLHYHRPYVNPTQATSGIVSPLITNLGVILETQKEGMRSQGGFPRFP